MASVNFSILYFFLKIKSRQKHGTYFFGNHTCTLKIQALKLRYAWKLSIMSCIWYSVRVPWVRLNKMQNQNRACFVKMIHIIWKTDVSFMKLITRGKHSIIVGRTRILMSFLSFSDICLKIVVFKKMSIIRRWRSEMLSFSLGCSSPLTHMNFVDFMQTILKTEFPIDIE